MDAQALPVLHIGCTGHRFLKQDDTEMRQVKARITDVLSKLKKTYSLVLHCCFALGADQLVAECARELDIPAVAHIPMPYGDYLNDIKNDALRHSVPYSAADESRTEALLAYARECSVSSDPVDTYAAASRAVLELSDKLIVLWDGVETPLFDAHGNPINRGGTYHTLIIAKDFGFAPDDIFIIPCSRA